MDHPPSRYGIDFIVFVLLLSSCCGFLFVFGCGVSFFFGGGVPASSCQWLFNSWLQFLCSHRRWVRVLLCCHLQLDITLSSHKFLDLFLDQGLANILYKESNVNILCFAGPVASVTRTQLFHCVVSAAMNNTEVNENGYSSSLLIYLSWRQDHTFNTYYSFLISDRKSITPFSSFLDLSWLFLGFNSSK